MNLTEEDTFNKLRRTSYVDACVIYTIACLHLPSNTPVEILNEIAKEDLKIAGWTIEELNIESRRQEDVGDGS